MRFIGSVSQRNADPKTAFSIGVIVTILIGCVSYFVFFYDLQDHLQKKYIGEVLGIIPAVIFVFIIHEVIHVVFFLLFGKGKAKIKVSRIKSLGAVVMHQINPEVYYSKFQMLVILLSPLVLLTVGLCSLSLFISLPFLLLVNVLLNAFGSSIDLYVSMRLMRECRKDHFMNIDPENIEMRIYASSSTNEVDNSQ